MGGWARVVPKGDDIRTAHWSASPHHSPTTNHHHQSSYQCLTSLSPLTPSRTSSITRLLLRPTGHPLSARLFVPLTSSLWIPPRSRRRRRLLVLRDRTKRHPRLTTGRVTSTPRTPADSPTPSSLLLSVELALVTVRRGFETSILKIWSSLGGTLGRSVLAPFQCPPSTRSGS